MRRWRTYSLIILLLAGIVCKAEDNPLLRVVSYNVENLFDCRHDSLKNDTDFLEDGSYHWNEGRYRQKLHHIAQVICGIGGWKAPALVGLLEVENDSCLYDLCTYHLRRNIYPYRFIHYESPDARGVDVALLYDSTQLTCVCSTAIRIPDTEHPTRDILYAEMMPTLWQQKQTNKRENGNDSISNSVSEGGIHCFVCHLPSQLGGAASTADRRQQVVDILQQQIDSLIQTDSASLILVMGDFNMQADANLIHGMHNLLLPYAEQKVGTHKYHGEWNCLDQFWVSDRLLQLLSKPDIGEPMHKDFQIDGKALIYAPEWLLEDDEKYLGVKPNRTYIGPKYHRGFSDHLPIVLDIRL